MLGAAGLKPAAPSHSPATKLPPVPPRGGPLREPGINTYGGVMVLLAPSPKPDYAAAVVRIERLGADLAAARKRLGLTPTLQAKQVGVGVSTLNGLIDGTTTNPTKATIVAGLTWLDSITGR